MAKKSLYAIAGIPLLIVGITLILVWWVDVVSIFRGGIGLALALAGLLVLYSANKK